MTWAEETMWMYDRTVEVPRLIAGFAPGEPQPPAVATIQTGRRSFLGVAFTSVSLQYYRDGNDSVAWHNYYREEAHRAAHDCGLEFGLDARDAGAYGKRARAAASLAIQPGRRYSL